MLPKVIIHNAVSLDGRITGFDVDMETYYGIAKEWNEDATLVGAGTLLAAPDEIPPEDKENVAPPKGIETDTKPYLVVPDSRGRIRSWHYLRHCGFWKEGIALLSDSTPESYIEYLKRIELPYIVSGSDHVDLRMALEELNERFGAALIRADSGGTLNGILLTQCSVSEVSMLIHPTVVGEGGVPLFRIPAGTKVPRLELKGSKELKNGLIWSRYIVNKDRPS